MDELKQMKETLIKQVQAQLGDLGRVSTHELGEVIDMIKDLSESVYYCSIVEAMEESSEDKKAQSFYMNKYLPPYDEYYRDMERPEGRMYYTDPNLLNKPNNQNWNNTNYDSSMRRRDPYMSESYSYPIVMRDNREGRSPMKRKAYIESKEMHQDKTKQMKDLEDYMAELSQDITEMIQMSSPEEKAILQKKLASLSSKIM